jgi:hypothetical protein
MNETSDYKNLILDFLNTIGIPYRSEELIEDTFIPGIMIRKGVLIIDEFKLKHPGDILHEAGHIAIMTTAERNTIEGNVQGLRAESYNDELAAILWSYAALKHLNLAPEIVFHPQGYKNESGWLIEQLESGNFIGLPLLVWMGLTTHDLFPKLNRWLRLDS